MLIDNLLNTNNIAPVTNNNCVSNRILPANILAKDRVTFTSNLLAKNSELITKEVLNAVKRENFLGDGVQGDVYKIPNTEYCAKLLNKNRLNPVNTWSFDITPQDRANHIVAKADNGDTIMRYIRGKALDLEEKPDVIYSLPKSDFKKARQFCPADKKIKEDYKNLQQQLDDMLKEEEIYY